MASLTDPARELQDFVALIGNPSSATGAKHIAGALGVAPWSTDFYQIIFCVMHRADRIATLIGQAQHVDEDLRLHAIDDLSGFKRAFDGSTLTKKWDDPNGGGASLVATHGSRIKYLSPEVRRIVSYPRLDEEEASDLITLIRTYLDSPQIISEVPPHLRPMVVSGLERFLFQLTMLKWTGAEYTGAQFRDFLAIVERVYEEVSTDETMRSAEWLALLGQVATHFKEKIESVKAYTDSGAYLALGYNLAAPALGWHPITLLT
jgi:hypothetical protein